MTHYLATTNCLSISLAAVSVGVILFTPIAGGNACYPTNDKFTPPAVIIEIWSL
jgi:hypothetical protein